MPDDLHHIDKEVQRRFNDAGEILQSTEATLEQRKKRYGEYSDHAKIAQGIKDIMHNANSWNICEPYQKQS